LRQRDGIFVLGAFGTNDGLLDVDVGGIVLAAHTHRGRAVGAQIALAECPARPGMRLPGRIRHQEFALDFLHHSLRSKTAMASIWAVCGNMSMTPARVRR